VRKDVSDLQKESDRIGEWQKAVSEHGDELVKMVKMVKMIVVHWEDHIDPLFVTLCGQVIANGRMEDRPSRG